MHNQDQIKARKGFNYWTPFYFLARWFRYGKTIENIQTRLLSSLPHHQTHWVIGDGNGFLSRQILNFLQPKSLHVFDISPSMLHKTQKAIHSSFAQFSVGSVQKIQFNSSVDCLHLPFVLDLLSDEEIVELSRKWFLQLPDNAYLHIVDFKPQKNQLHQHTLYALFKFTTGAHRKKLPDLMQLLSAQWKCVKSHQNGRFEATLWQKTH